MATIQAKHIKWDEFGDTESHIKLGNLLICFGQKTWNNPNTGAYGETNSGTITFPQEFKSTPMIIAQLSDMSGACGEYCSTSQESATSFAIWGGHVGPSNATSVKARWIAIGEAATD